MTAFCCNDMFEAAANDCTAGIDQVHGNVPLLYGGSLQSFPTSVWRTVMALFIYLMARFIMALHFNTILIIFSIFCRSASVYTAGAGARYSAGAQSNAQLSPNSFNHLSIWDVKRGEQNWCEVRMGRKRVPLYWREEMLQGGVLAGPDFFVWIRKVPN